MTAYKNIFYKIFLIDFSWFSTAIFNAPAIVRDHVSIPVTLVTFLYSPNVLMKLFPLFFTQITKIFRKKGSLMPILQAVAEV